MIYKNIPGWFHDTEASTLFNLASNAEGPILEIGHFYGRSTSCICEALKTNNKKNKFVSYDLGFTTSEEVREFYSTVMDYDRQTGLVPKLYHEAFSKKITTTEIARENLKKFNLESYVNLISGNFIELDQDQYSLIFCDATHDAKEIETNLPHIIERSLDNCIWAFHDLNVELIQLVEKNSNSKFLSLTKSLGVFQFLGNVDEKIL
jgi:Methyltransferase domain